jgi:hypothetical protein
VIFSISSPVKFLFHRKTYGNLHFGKDGKVLEMAPIKRLRIYVVSEMQHYSMNTLLNMRHIIQRKLEPKLGRDEARKWAIKIVMIFEEPIKVVFY